MHIKHHLSLEEAARLGWLVASGRFTKTRLRETSESEET
jgi:hypothetical protein